MKYKINMHSHSYWSDGHNGLAVMTLEAKSLGYTAYVSTDHVYSLHVNEEGIVSNVESSYSMSLNKWSKQCEEADAITTLSGFPVICGIELSIKGFEEVVVIGRSAIKAIYEIRDEKGFVTVHDLANVKVIHNCLMNLCHPMNAERFIAGGGHRILDAYEFIHSGSPMFRNAKEDLYEQFGITKICNSDAHSASTLYRCCNLVDDLINTENELINYFKDKWSVEFHIEPNRGQKINSEEVF